MADASPRGPKANRPTSIPAHGAELLIHGFVRASFAGMRGHSTFTMFGSGPEGKEMRHVTIEYPRTK